MRRRAFQVALGVALAAIVVLLPASAGADTTVLTFSGSFTPPKCGPPFDFSVGASTKTIDIVATADLPVNDIVLELVRDGAVLARADTLTSPEAIHYAPGGDIPQGTYSAVVCPFDKNQNLLTTSYHGVVTLTELPLPGLPTPPPATKPGKVAFSGSASFAPATLVSAHFLGGEPQLSMERRIAGSQAGRLDPGRVYVNWPLTSRTQTSQLSRSTDGGESFRLLVDPLCPQRNRPNCMTLGGGDSESDINLVTGDLFFADQEALVVNEGLASSTDHGDSFPVTRQFAITNTTTGVDRQWLAWIDPSIMAPLGVEAFLSWHMPGAGEYVVGVGPNGIPLAQPVPQIPAVGQSGQSAVDNSNGPGRGWIYQPFWSTLSGDVSVATASGPQWQDSAAWKTTIVSTKSPDLFTWVAFDGHGNAYLVWITDGKVYLAVSPIDDARNNPQLGGRPGTYWTPEVQVSPSSLKSTAFPEVTAGAPGRIAIAYMGTKDCNKKSSDASDNCDPSAHWGTYVSIITDALALTTGGTAHVAVGQVNHRVEHRGSICTSGTTCSGDRSLLDMIDVGYDQSGRVGVVTQDNNNRLAAPDLTDNSKNGPFDMFAKETAGPSLLGTAPVNVAAPKGPRADAAQDATWPDDAGGKDLPSLDLLGTSLSVSGGKLTATLKLADATQAGMARDLAAFKARSTTDPKDRLQYIVWFETADDVFHLSMEYQNGKLRFFGGRVDQNDAVQNGTGAVVGVRYVTDKGFPVTGSLGNGKITLTVPLKALGPTGGKAYSVTGLATVQPSEDNSTAKYVVNSGRTIDATPPFDASL